MHTKVVKGVNLFLCVIVKSNCRVKTGVVCCFTTGDMIRNTQHILRTIQFMIITVTLQSCISVGIATSQVKQKTVLPQSVQQSLTHL